MIWYDGVHLLKYIEIHKGFKVHHLKKNCLIIFSLFSQCGSTCLQEPKEKKGEADEPAAEDPQACHPDLLQNETDQKGHYKMLEFQRLAFLCPLLSLFLPMPSNAPKNARAFPLGILWATVWYSTIAHQRF